MKSDNFENEEKRLILVVEDDESVAKMVEATLFMGDLECDLCGDGLEALNKVHSREYDLILLDIMLPGMDGYKLLEKIKPMNIPVIFLTARLDLMDKVKGLRMGAEDYIVKPFEPAELLARVEVVLRRYGKRMLESVQFRNIVVNFAEHQVENNGQKVVLTPKEFDILAYFIKNKNKVVRKERLLAEVWGFNYSQGTRTVDTHVLNIKKKMGLQDCLRTIPKIGFLLEDKE